MNQSEINFVLTQHIHFLFRDRDGWEEMRANLVGVDLRGANLRDANLREADLMGSNLVGSNLVGVDLRGANLRYADLRYADLRYADLSGANLSGANLRDANLRDANLMESDISFPMACPDTGSFIGWKQTRNAIVELLIPEDAKRSSATGRKCRASKAIVMEFQNEDGTPSNVEVANSIYDPTFEYHVGDTLEIPDFDENRFNECAPGIHFFMTRHEAILY